MPEMTTEEFLKTSNREVAEQWAIDVNQDPYSVPLNEMNPAHPALFEAGTMLPWFERLRKELFFPTYSAFLLSFDNFRIFAS